MNVHFLADLKSSNGTAVAVVSCQPGDDPYTHLQEWYRKQGFKEWDKIPRRKYQYIGRQEGAGKEPFVFVMEWYDGVVSTGNVKRVPKKTDLGGEW